MAKAKRTEAALVLRFADVIGDRHLITATVGPALEPVLLSLGRAPDYRTSGTHATFLKKHAAQSNDFRVHYRAGADWAALDLLPTTENYHHVQTLRGGRWLLVRGRAASERDRNVRVYEVDGTPGPAFHAGDGVEDVQATEGGQIWVSYFDEGVFGDTPLGRAGLACLDPDGRPAFRLTDLTDPVLQSMADCYALNVRSDREAWLCFYTDFPLVRLVDWRVAGHWRVPVAGSHGFAVTGDRVLFGGSYTKPHALFLGRLGTTRFVELTPAAAGGGPLRKFWAFGRRHLLFLATADALYSVDLAALPDVARG